MLTPLARAKPVLIGAVFLALGATFAAMSHRSIVSDSRRDFFVRWINGEPGALQDVNDAADWILKTGTARELEALADDILLSASLREQARHGTVNRLHSAPIDKLPAKFWDLGVRPREAPAYIWIHSDNSVHLHWARYASAWHEIVITAAPSASSPRGTFARRVTDRVFVVAGGD